MKISKLKNRAIKLATTIGHTIKFSRAFKHNEGLAANGKCHCGLNASVKTHPNNNKNEYEIVFHLGCGVRIN